MILAVASWQGWKAVSAVLALSIAAYIVAFAPSRAVQDWDIVGYTVATLRDGKSDAASLHARTWAIVEASVSRAVLTELTAKDAFRRRQYEDPAALLSQLPLYDIKLGYVLVLKALALVVDPVRAMMIVSTASALGLLALLVGAASRAQGIATVAWLPLVGLFNFGALSADLASDSLATCVYAAGAAAFLSGRMGLAIIVFILATFVRPDILVLNAILGAVLLRRYPRPAVLLLAGSLIAGATAVVLSGHIGWWGQFAYNFVDPAHDLSRFKPDFSAHVYLVTLAASLKALLHSPWVYGALGTALLAIVLLAGERHEPGSLLLAALVAGAGARFVLYPSVEFRLYWPIIFGLSLVLLVAAAGSRFRPRVG